MSNPSTSSSAFRWQYILIGVVVILAGWMMTSYNSLVTKKEVVTTAWKQVETQYQRRFDLVPNLVATVKGAANFEDSTFSAIAEARGRWMSAGQVRSQQLGAAQSFDSALSKLIVSVEAYPQLQATQSFRDLMAQLEGTENRVSVARKDFNDAVLAYNLKVKTFPANVLASIFGFEPETGFTSQAGAENAPSVNFAQ